ncbi:MAG: diguanylate cyclase, partial [Clostridiales bacterium]|nr:diguanylate cyclase [Clostridiales bacterium]
FLRDKDFDKAYEALSAEDKARISYQDFIKWQGAVTRIYRLLDYECQPCSRERDMTLRGFLYKEVCGFTVVTVEKNLLMNRLEKDVVNKRVVLEASRWRIHTGYEDIRPLTARFEELGGLLEARNVIGDMLELYGNKDSRTGLLNKKGFIEAAEREAWRYERYGNSFSLALFELDCPEHLVERCAAILGNSIRKTDIAGRWSETGFMLMLPETGIRDGLNAVMKLKAALDKAMAHEKGTNKKSNIRIGIEEFKGSMEHTLGKLQNKIGTADS